MRLPPGTFLLAILLGAGLGWAVGCAGTPDPARIGSEGGGGSLPGASSGEPTPGTSSGDVTSSGSGNGGNGDPLDPFAEEGLTYFSKTVAVNATEAHAEAGGVDGGAPLPTANPDCMSCHDGSSAQQFATAGLIFQTASVACASCEVYFVDGTAHRVKVTTAADGTFSVLTGSYGPVSAETKVGIKRGAQTLVMPISEDVDDGAGALRGCNSASCHSAAAEGPIVLGSQ